MSTRNAQSRSTAKGSRATSRDGTASLDGMEEVVFKVPFDKETLERLVVFVEEFRHCKAGAVIAEVVANAMESAETDTVYRYDLAISVCERK